MNKIPNIKIRNCPKCEKEIKYSNKYVCNNAIINKSLCKSCGIQTSITPTRLRAMSKRVLGSKNPMYGMSGDKNHFYGKKHSKSTKKKLSIINIGKIDTEITKQKKRLASTGINNPMYGKSVYSVWLNKYGKKIADKKLKQYKIKQSKQSSGKNNPMYGKPSPQGSGNGWKGWYKGRFFRSLRELMFIINYIERWNLKYESLEKACYAIKYKDYKGQTRNYFSDYLINDKYFVEVKPKKLWDTPINRLKRSAAEKICNKKGWKYKFIDPKIRFEQIKSKYLTGEIKFTDKSLTRFLKYQK